MTRDGDATETRQMRAWKHGADARPAVDASMKSAEPDSPPERAERGGAAPKTREERAAALERDERLTGAIEGARHTALVEAGRHRDLPLPSAAVVAAQIVEMRRNPPGVVHDLAALRAAVARLGAEAEQADELLAEYAARTALADELVRLVQRIGVLEDGSEAEWWQAVPLHGRVAELCGEYETTYLGGPEESA